MICAMANYANLLQSSIQYQLCQWYHIGIDFIGPISPASHQGNRYILTITDYFKNFVEEVPMKRKYFDNVAAALFKVVKHMHYDEVLKLIIY